MRPVIFIEGDESYFVRVVEMAELIGPRGAEFGNAREKPKSQTLGADVA
jgi:hypothetical protein